MKRQAHSKGDGKTCKGDADSDQRPLEANPELPSGANSSRRAFIGDAASLTIMVAALPLLGSDSFAGEAEPKLVHSPMV